MTALKFLQFALFVATIVGTNSTLSRKIEWVAVSQSEAVLLLTEPVGLEAGDYSYLCRTVKDGWPYAGKLSIKDGMIICIVPADGAEYQSTKFEVGI